MLYLATTLCVATHSNIILGKYFWVDSILILFMQVDVFAESLTKSYRKQKRILKQFKHLKFVSDESMFSIRVLFTDITVIIFINQ